ncbi:MULTISPECIES: Ger(x)C family spore germination protein [Clostridium]|uniref:Spore germination protein B3 n=2 Tax=Clostridium TaxID=1485 RepID=A0A166SKD1_9CLOT|nr:MULTISPECIES: Ger(x)C family spore germination protein [Clostridium]OAA92444.1 Spore germination protein B3 precursor [Clostridium coskatii]OBR89927.1 spore germination protein B3 precursor [Clostridium coskatii]RMC98399.1 Ger(x)C family spore germination protein [Clostridium autoethanogenum]
MKIKRRILSILLVLLSSVTLCGCWNYVDIEKYSLVTGLSLDKDKKNNKYVVNAEILNFQMSGKEAKAVSNIIESKGNTIFDAMRNMINTTGNKLHWGHAKIFIISKDIAEEGIIPALDLPYRDAEMREEMYVLISNKNLAKEILQSKTITSNLKSFDIAKMIEHQRTLANAPIARVYEIINNIEGNDISPVLPLYDIKTINGKRTVELIGTAVFKGDKLVGSLNTDESKYFLFAANQIDKGLLAEKILDGNQITNITLEIFGSKTKIKPIHKNGKLSINMNIRVDASIAEIEGSKDFIQESGRQRLKQAAEESLKVSIGNTVNKVQNNYETDIFGFGKHIKSDIPSVWNDVKDKWDDTFKNMNVNINIEIQLRNSGLNSKTIQRGM